MNCGDCKNKGKQICTVCCSYQGGIPDRWEPKPLTNADRIRAMSDEELAYFIAEPSVAPPPWCKEIPVCPHMDEDIVPCHECALDWLKQEVSK